MRVFVIFLFWIAKCVFKLKLFIDSFKECLGWHKPIGIDIVYFLWAPILGATQNGLPCVRSERSILWIPDLLLVFGVFLALSGEKNFVPPTKKQKWSSPHHEIRQFQKTHTINDPLQHINQRATQQLTRRCTFWTAEWSLLAIFGWKITRIWGFWGGAKMHSFSSCFLWKMADEVE